MTIVRINRELSAPPERVWLALTDPQALMAWFWPESFGTKVTADVRPGGRYRIGAQSPEMGVTGDYQEVEPTRRLVFSWRWDGDDDKSLVTVELSPAVAGTRLDLVHERLTDDADRDRHIQGWNDCLDRLPAYL